MNLGKYAAVVPLDYDSNSGPSRTENSVIYFNDCWDDISDLFEAPLEYLRGQQFHWRQSEDESVSWQLIAPVSLTIMCGYSDPGAFVGTLARLWPHLGVHIPNVDAGSLFKSQHDMVEAINALAGSFMVEFNTFTSVARVIYFPPSAKILSEIRPDGPPYQGGFMNPIYIKATALGISTAVLHFDLDDSSPRARADFLTSYIEDPHWFTKLLNGYASDGSMQMWKYELTKAEKPKQPPGKLIPCEMEKVHFVPGVPDPWPPPTAPTPFQAEILAARMHPTIVSNNHSVFGGSGCCGHLTAYNGDVFNKPNDTFLGLMNLENYMRYQFDPQRLIANVLRAM